MDVSKCRDGSLFQKLRVEKVNVAGDKNKQKKKKTKTKKKNNVWIIFSTQWWNNDGDATGNWKSELKKTSSKTATNRTKEE